MTDLSKVKKEFIDASSVPKSYVTSSSQWDEILSAIPKGQALVLHEPEVNRGTVRAALRTRQVHGRFKNIQLSTRGPHGKSTIYLVNTDKPMVRTPRVVQQQNDVQTS